ncbi:hypothetical protein CAPTEDRAFT_196106 [Capitella teleta]|uniref:Endonuclease/exonuclease/phosphatase domain-containing protein n=1 Tax=Capitella teleta TaxID=283909 RepID=R7T6P3_CAPTE|nr:hypothetical protein CAPTEDRAFT_196106 [Capitella teleta]|eukprot:ELT89048.1 hypothetical protein CAPTEDRAFT_196106 [Capitella teleta]
MPCDTQVAYHDNQLVFEEVLNDVADLIQISNIDRIVFGGDLNTELSRRASTHTRSLNQFVTNESFSFLSALSCYEVDYTHESDAHGTRSTLDHFIVSSQLGRDDFWTEVQKMRGNNSATPTIVDDCLSEDDIALCFREKYNTLYNSVGYVPEEMARLRQEIEANACRHEGEMCPSHVLSVRDVTIAVSNLKRGEIRENMT